MKGVSLVISGYLNGGGRVYIPPLVLDLSELFFFNQPSKLTYIYTAEKGVYINGRLLYITPLQSDAEKTAFQEIKGKFMRFYVIPFRTTETEIILLTRESWRIIYEAGFVELDHYLFQVSLDEVETEKGIVKIFPLRDVRI